MKYTKKVYEVPSGDTVIWRRFKLWRFEIRTNNIDLWFGIEYRPTNGWVRDVTVSKHGINYQKLPF